MSEILSRDYMGQVTDRDVEMVNLLINNPDMSIDELGAKLEITKQAVAERKSKLEQMGYTKKFYFWNITPRFEGTSRILIQIKGDFGKVDRISQILDRFNPIMVFFRTDPESYFAGKASSLTATISEVEGILHINSKEEENRLRRDLENPGLRQVSIHSILFSRLLGERCDITPKTPEQIEDIAKAVAQQLASEASIQAVLYEQHEQPVDQFDLIVIRDERFQPQPDSYERRVEQVLLDYHFASLRHFLRWKGEWLEKMKVIYVRKEALRRRIERKIRSIQTGDS